MREIKFRAWDGKKFTDAKKLICFGDGCTYETIEANGAVIFLPKAYYKIMQYTGLKDKNGKEIYEADILSYYQPYAKRTDIHTVKWDEGLACFALFEGEDRWLKECDWLKIKDIEIVGNIYENPELIKK